MELKAVRGMHDLWGDEMARWSYVERKVQSLLATYGYSEIRTPVLEKLEVFSHTVGEATDIVEKQMYTVQDRGPKEGLPETLVLRPEGTASCVRALIEHQLHRLGYPQRYFYCIPMFRYERPQKGRLRQFHQIGAEFILDPTPHADAELIRLLHDIFQSFGLNDYEIRLNSVGCGDCRPAFKENLKNYFRPKLNELCEQCRARFERAPMRILDCKNEACQSLAKGAPLILENLCAKCGSHHKTLKSLLLKLEVPFKEDPFIVRGLDYYSQTAFEFTSSLLGAQSALGGGGRYDGLSERFGEKSFPAIGWALGVERLMMALEAKQLLANVKPAGPTVFLAPLGQTAFDHLYPMLFELRKVGIAADMLFDTQKSLKAILKNANRANAHFALVLGDDELKTGSAQLKDMHKGEAATVLLKDAVEEIQRRLKS